MSDQYAGAITPNHTRSLVTQLTVASLVRLLINTSRRFPYPFASALSSGLGVPFTSITSLIAINQLTGILSPLFGPLSDRWGYRVMMLVGLGIVAAGMLAGGVLPFYGVVLVALFLAGLGKSIFDPALGAYVGERVPYERRGLAIGLLEISWAGSSLIGIPLVGFLIEQLEWRAPFVVIGGLGLLGVAVLGFIIPKEQPYASQSATLINFRQAWQQLRRERAAKGILAYGFFLSMANDSLFVVYGVWLQDSFGLGLTTLGMTAIVIGVAELFGETLTATMADRVGLKRAVVIGLILTSLSYLLLPVIGQTLVLALAGLFVLFLAFEFTIVTGVSLTTEVLPKARATMVSSVVATTGLGRVIGALLGGPLWLWGGLLMTGVVSAMLTVLALGLFLWGLHKWRTE